MQNEQTINESESEYVNVIRNNPSQLFKDVNEDMINKWKEHLIPTEDLNCFINEENFSENNNNPIDIAKNMKIVHNDVLRTRVRESYIMPSFQNTLEFLLIYYCNIHYIYYKQGLNEIFGPFLLLRYKFKSLSLLTIFSMAQGFIDKFFSNVYHDKSPMSIKASSALIELLLKYHAPDIYLKLHNIDIQPELYSINWLMNLSSAKTEIGPIYRLWNHLIQENDEFMSHYFIIAFLIMKRKEIAKTHFSMLVVTLNQFTITTNTEVDLLYAIAKQVKKDTPYSYQIFANKLNVFNGNVKDLEKLYNEFKPQNYIAMPLYAKELLYLSSHNREFVENEKQIPHSLLLILTKYIIIDLRNKQNKHKSDGALPLASGRNSIIITPKHKDSLLQEVENDLKDIPNIDDYYIIILTSHTNKYEEYRDRYYLHEEYVPEMVWGDDIGARCESICFIDPKISKTLPKNDKINVSEYDNFRRVYKHLIKKNYKYVSICYGGFIELHDQSMKFNMPLEKHKKSKCSYCKAQKQKKKSKKDTSCPHSNKNKIEKIEEEEERNSVFKYNKADLLLKDNQSKHNKKFQKSDGDLLIGNNDKMIMSEFIQFIKEYNYMFFIGKLIEQSLEHEEIIILIQLEEIAFYKIDTNEYKTLIKFNSIYIKHISRINSNKGIVNIKYKQKPSSLNNKENTIIIDFITPTDSNKFIYSFNEARTNLRNSSNVKHKIDHNN
jgi:hypothetical protein